MESMAQEQIIGVLSGGDSPERDVSLVSGRGVHEALVRMGHRAELIEIDTADDLVPRLREIDVVFNCLHGGAGEDGTVQVLLDVMGIPYAGSGAQACARAMDKVRSRSLLAAQEIPIPPGASFEEGDLEAFLHAVAVDPGFPLVIKPGNGGSTVAVHLVDDRDSLAEAAGSILETFPSLIVECYIEGRELTIGILRTDGADAPLPVIEIRIPGKLFDYEAKYSDGVAEFLAPAPLDDAVARSVQEVALNAHRALGCAGYSRVDVRLGEDGVPYVLEANTLPGMTPLSDLPRAAAVAGIDYDRLVEACLRTADKEDIE